VKNYPWLDEYLRSKQGAVKDYKAEWGWHRYMIGGKMFAAIMHPSEKYNAMYAGKDLINLKCDPMMSELLRENHPEVLPAFYCGKLTWNSVDLGGGLPGDILKQMIDDSYRLVFNKLTKKMQKEVIEACISLQ